MQANPFKGERGIEVDGRKLRLAYSFEAMTAIQEHFGVPFPVFAQMLEDGLEWAKVPLVFWIGLQQCQPEIEEPEGRALAAAFGVGETLNEVAAAFRGAFPDKEAATDGEGRPRKGPARAGTSSAAGTST